MTVKEIRELQNDELLVEIDALKKIIELRFQQAISQLENPARLKKSARQLHGLRQ